MKKVLVFGAGSWAKLVTYYIVTYTGQDVLAYVADADMIKEHEFLGRPLVEFENVVSIYPPDQYEMYLGVGYRNMNQNRERVFAEAKEKGYVIPTFIHPTAILNSVNLGEGNFIMENVVFEPFTKIGYNNIIFTASMIAHDNIIGNHNFISQNVSIAGDCIIGNNCFLGISSTISNGVHIADFTLAGASAHVAKSTKPYDVVVPARSITLDGKRSTDFI